MLLRMQPITKQWRKWDTVKGIGKTMKDNSSDKQGLGKQDIVTAYKSCHATIRSDHLPCLQFVKFCSNGVPLQSTPFAPLEANSAPS